MSDETICLAFRSFQLSAFLANCCLLDDEEREKGLVEELMEILPYNAPATVDLLLRVLEALPREVNITNIDRWISMI